MDAIAVKPTFEINRQSEIREIESDKNGRFARFTLKSIYDLMCDSVRKGFSYLNVNKATVAKGLLLTGATVAAYYLFQYMPDFDFGTLFGSDTGGAIGELSNDVASADYSSADALSGADANFTTLESFKPEIIELNLGDYKIGDPITLNGESYSFEEFRANINNLIPHEDSVLKINIGDGARFSTEQALHSLLEESGISYSASPVNFDSPLERVFDPDESYLKLGGVLNNN